MKKMLLIAAFLCGVFTLAAAEIPAKGWYHGQMQGKFTITNKGEYPIIQKCSEASAGRAIKKVGVWGRFIHKATLVEGKKYEFKVTYKLTGSKKARLALWVRDCATVSLNFPATETPKTVSCTFKASKNYGVLYLNLQGDVAEMEVISAELNQLD